MKKLPAARIISPSWTKRERSVFKRLKSPGDIQEFLDDVRYSTADDYQSPRDVISSCQAHCFDGALFAAAALEQLGFPPLIMELVAVRDDDHLLAVFKHKNCFGAIAKSNFSGLRFREPVYRSVRELAMSYFEFYFNLAGEKTLRRHSALLHLAQFNKLAWHTSAANLQRIADALDGLKHFSLLPQGAPGRLNRIDRRSFASGIVGANKSGLVGIARQYK